MKKKKKKKKKKKNSGNFWWPLKKQQYSSFHGAPCTYHFQSRKCLDSCLLIDFYLTLVAQIPCGKLTSVLEFWVLRESGINVFIFVEHPIYNIFNVQSVLIIDSWFYFVSSFPNSTSKTFLCSKFRRSAKEATILIGHPEKWSEFC